MATTTSAFHVSLSDKISAVTFSLAAFFPVVQFLRAFSLSENSESFVFLDGMRIGWPWLLMGVGAFLTDLITFIIKRFVERAFPQTTFWRRPKNAFACDALSMHKEIDSTGKSGFPSGHSATIAFFAFAVFLTDPVLSYFKERKEKNKNRGLIIRGLITPTIIACIITFLIMMARVKKSCHTVLQTIVGASIGIGMASLYIWLVGNYNGSLRYP